MNHIKKKFLKQLIECLKIKDYYDIIKNGIKFLLLIMKIKFN